MDFGRQDEVGGWVVQVRHQREETIIVKESSNKEQTKAGFKRLRCCTKKKTEQPGND